VKQLIASLDSVPARAIWEAVSDVREMRPIKGAGLVVVHHRRCGIIADPEDEDACNCTPVRIRVSLVTPQA